MSTTIKVKVKAGSEGELFIPASLLRDIGFVANDEATLTLISLLDTSAECVDFLPRMACIGRQGCHSEERSDEESM